MRSKPRRAVVSGVTPSISTSSSPLPLRGTSIPRVCANFRTTLSGTTPAISWISRGKMGVGGSVAPESRAADCRYVMARRRSPEDVEMRAEMTGSFTGTFSMVAMCSRRSLADEVSRGLKRNFEHRDARGSMILDASVGPKHIVRRTLHRRTLSRSCTPNRIALCARNFP